MRWRLAASASRHATEGRETPTDHPLVRRLLRRYARTRGTARKKQEPLLIERLPAVLMAMPDDLPSQPQIYQVWLPSDQRLLGRMIDVCELGTLRHRLGLAQDDSLTIEEAIASLAAAPSPSLASTTRPARP